MRESCAVQYIEESPDAGCGGARQETAGIARPRRPRRAGYVAGCTMIFTLRSL
ncbi:hypothetical protein BURMUCF1_A0718 [Burkholderia multivorans ATCC BAA-247]|nr:hypothetical protein BURMUCF1_A0718 [Burkholderia multivorans ATCC BAA-247]